METTKETTPKNGTPIDVYKLINDKIIAALEKGTVPWRKPWKDANGEMPKNLATNRPYRGINILLLLMAGYEQNLFLTFKQAKELGAKIKDGEKANMVVFWKQIEKNEVEKEEAQTDEKKLMLRYYSVFNIAQCENIPERFLTPPPREERTFTPIQACEEIMQNMPDLPDIRHKQNKAFYNPLEDFINMPKQKAFESDEAYYATLFHELVHSTGHYSRLNRKTLIEMSEFGSDAYSHEELVAEIGTCYLQNETGITSEFEQSTAYIQEWIKRLKNDKRFIYSAATQAQKATDFILDINDESETKELEE